METQSIELKRCKHKTKGFLEFVPAQRRISRNFLSMGGFIEGVKIGRGSPYYHGLAKQALLKAFLEYQNKNKKVAMSLRQ